MKNYTSKPHSIFLLVALTGIAALFIRGLVWLFHAVTPYIRGIVESGGILFLLLLIAVCAFRIGLELSPQHRSRKILSEQRPEEELKEVVHRLREQEAAYHHRYIALEQALLKLKRQLDQIREPSEEFSARIAAEVRELENTRMLVATALEEIVRKKQKVLTNLAELRIIDQVEDLKHTYHPVGEKLEELFPELTALELEAELEVVEQLERLDHPIVGHPVDDELDLMDLASLRRKLREDGILRDLLDP
ncbi:MAG: hypothetical protein KDC32_17290 [Saprospiraceae bacterium]|nr:hypothetical protein [Saprospiraceae bacterium]MCB0682637.1 hypothetical protein [Saprospiraceae bacterium]